MKNPPNRHALPAEHDKARFVEDGFNGIARTYDRLNDCISFGLHRSWKRALFRLAELRTGESVLDICTGTGDLAYIAAAVVGGGGRVVALDFASGMLSVAAGRTGWCHRAAEAPPLWTRADAGHLPFPCESFDLVTVGYGLRNVADLPEVFREVKRVLKPGGRFVSLDTCEPGNPILRIGYRFHSFTLIPWMGRILAGNADMYRYLPASASAFETPEKMRDMLQGAGFSGVSVHRKLFGAAAIVLARRTDLTASPHTSPDQLTHG